MMSKKYSKSSWIRDFLSSIFQELIFGIDLMLEYVYIFIELPLQNACGYFGNLSLYQPRQRLLFQFIRNLTGLLVQSYLLTFLLYFICLFFAPLFSLALQRSYFIDPLLSTNRQCINIQFIRVHQPEFNSRLKENFLHENLIIGEESQQNEFYDHRQLYQLFDLLINHQCIICQRSLYLYARFQTYAQFLHSNHSYFRFSLPKYARSFAIDQPPFVDLCIQAFNRSHTEQIKAQLLSLATYAYSSMNFFIFDFNYTQITVTLYELNSESTHLERISIHTGWLRDSYSQFQFFKYDDALSTVLFDGFATEQQSIDYFNYTHILLPADSLLGLNEMIQQVLLILPLCQTTS